MRPARHTMHAPDDAATRPPPVSIRHARCDAPVHACELAFAHASTACERRPQTARRRLLGGVKSYARIWFRYPRRDAICGSDGCSKALQKACVAACALFVPLTAAIAPACEVCNSCLRKP